MSYIRRQLSAWSISWLLCQVASLCTLLPPQCCAAHVAAAGQAEDCHSASAPAAGAECPMHASTGEVCPMHDGSESGTSGSACSMRGLCNGPAVALGSLFAIPGILLEPSALHVDLSGSLLVADVTTPLSTLLSFDPPPPRS
jgi:hypothetical protein